MSDFADEGHSCIPMSNYDLNLYPNVIKLHHLMQQHFNKA